MPLILDRPKRKARQIETNRAKKKQEDGVKRRKKEGPVRGLKRQGKVKTAWSKTEEKRNRQMRRDNKTCETWLSLHPDNLQESTHTARQASSPPFISALLSSCGPQRQKHSRGCHFFPLTHPEQLFRPHKKKENIHKIHSNNPWLNVLPAITCSFATTVTRLIGAHTSHGRQTTEDWRSDCKRKRYTVS